VAPGKHQVEDVDFGYGLFADGISVRASLRAGWVIGSGHAGTPKFATVSNDQVTEKIILLSEAAPPPYVLQWPQL
jgi:hypothetical protein